MPNYASEEARGQSDSGDECPDLEFLRHWNRTWGPGLLIRTFLRPGHTFTLAAENASDEKGKRAEQTDFQHERHLPGEIKNIGKWQASLWPARRSARQLSASLRCSAR